MPLILRERGGGYDPAADDVEERTSAPPEAAPAPRRPGKSPAGVFLSLLLLAAAGYLGGGARGFFQPEEAQRHAGAAPISD